MATDAEKRAAKNKALANSAKGKTQTPTAEAARRAANKETLNPKTPGSNVKVIPASKDTQGKMDAVRTREGLARQENARINKAAQRLLDKTGQAIVDQSRAGARTSAGISGKGGVNVGKMFRGGGGAGMFGLPKNR